MSKKISNPPPPKGTVKPPAPPGPPTKGEAMHPILGKKVRDIVTGFKGIAIAYTEYLTGCNNIGVSPGVGKDGKPGEAQWFDETRIEILDNGIREKFAEKKKAFKTATDGGPQEHPARVF